MANATLPRNTDSLGGALRQVGDPLPVAAGQKLVQGCIVALNADGYLIDGYAARGSDGYVVLGIAAKSVDNSALDAVDGGASGVALSGIFEMDNDTADGYAIAQADVGTACNVVDNHTVQNSQSGSTGSKAGTVFGFNNANGQVWVIFNQVLPV